MGKTIAKWLGFERQSQYVKDYFFRTNMKASIYMSVVVIVLELWMIFRMTRTVIVNNYTGDAFWSLVDKYYTNYFILLGAGILTLLYAVRFLMGKRWVSVFALLTIMLSGAVCAYEISEVFGGTGADIGSTSFQNHVVLLAAGIVLIFFSVMIQIRAEVERWACLAVLYVFSFVCIDFGIIISTNSYAHGEQILTFLTMVLYVICLLTWKPVTGFAVLTLSYAVLFFRLNSMPAPNTGEIGLTESFVINGFTMWISTLMFCISNYNKTLQQALKDEHLEEVNAYLSKISVYDELTGIHNMVHFRSEAEKILGYVTTDRENIVFLYFDIENFKYYNEKYGFHEGNALLIEFAKMIDASFKGSLVSRFSDDHFVVLTRYEGCRDIIDDLSVRLHSLQKEVHLELKCGAYRPSQDETVDPSVACDRARFACNNIKKRYEVDFRLYDRILEDRFRLKQYIVNNIDTAIENGYIKVFYQPVISTVSNSIVGFEALARWQDPMYGLLPPGVFIEILEEHRQIHKLDQCVIELVCRDYREAADKGLAFAPISLNFSRLDFELCDIVGYLEEQAYQYHVPQEYLDVEVTESALSDQQNLLQRALKILRRDGFKVWLDDFGSGYSSLNVLKDYQFDVLKIDMKFLSGFSDNEKTRPILENIVKLSRNLEMVSLTEGVETQEQYDFLKTIGCDRVQGYLFSKPVPIGELRERIAAGELSIDSQYASISK